MQAFDHFSASVRAKLDAAKTLTTPGTRMLGALQGRNLYMGTVPTATVAKRRAANKVARRSRAVNRRGAKN